MIGNKVQHAHIANKRFGIVSDRLDANWVVVAWEGTGRSVEFEDMLRPCAERTLYGLDLSEGFREMRVDTTYPMGNSEADQLIERAALILEKVFRKSNLNTGQIANTLDKKLKGIPRGSHDMPLAFLVDGVSDELISFGGLFDPMAVGVPGVKELYPMDRTEANRRLHGVALTLEKIYRESSMDEDEMAQAISHHLRIAPEEYRPIPDVEAPGNKLKVALQQVDCTRLAAPPYLDACAEGAADMLVRATKYGANPDKLLLGVAEMVADHE